jgi:acyl-coenzyme A synthetase/AMP-(fatty) acid ligase
VVVRALIVKESGERVALGPDQIAGATERVAAGLAARGAGPGDVVLVRLPKGAPWLFAMRALYRIGAVALPCSEQLTDLDVADRVERSGAMLTLLEPADVPEADGPARAPRLGGDEPAFLLFTSGTEGKPKGAVHPRRYHDSNRLQAERWMGVRSGDRVWCTAAAGWSKSVRNVWLAAELMDAETVIHEARFDPAGRLDLIAALRPDVLCMSPTEYRLCAKAADFGRHDLSHVREAVAAGEALDGATVEHWREAYGIAVRDGYGQTETGAVTGVLAGSQPDPGAMGTPLPGVEVEILDGELCVVATTLPTLFAGYWRDEAATASRLVGGRWHTGDMVERDGDGRLIYRGRRDDVISSAGYRIGPGEVEAALASHPAVLEAAAVGLPDEDRGEIVHADVVLREGVAATTELADALRDHVRHVTAPYKYPRSLRFVAALPRTTTGKVRRAAIRADLADAAG